MKPPPPHNEAFVHAVRMDVCASADARDDGGGRADRDPFMCYLSFERAK